MALHKGRQRRKLQSTKVQGMLDTLHQRITTDQSLSADQLISLSNAAVALAQTLNSMDLHLLEQRKRRKVKVAPKDIFSIRGTDQ
jgi:hypothetical protein